MTHMLNRIYQRESRQELSGVYAATSNDDENNHQLDQNHDPVGYYHPTMRPPRRCSRQTYHMRTMIIGALLFTVVFSASALFEAYLALFYGNSTPRSAIAVQSTSLLMKIVLIYLLVVNLSWSPLPLHTADYDAISP